MNSPSLPGKTNLASIADAEADSGLASEEGEPAVFTTTAQRTGPSRRQFIHGSAVTMAGFGGAQVVRLASTVILTRLLTREAYGLYLLGSVFLEGLANFTAVGSGPAIIRDERGDDPAFLNTAWTLQVVRGLGLWLAACLLAIPYAWFYGHPVLWALIPVMALTVVLDSFDAVAIHWCFRHMKLGRVTALEFLRQLMTLLVMIDWAIRNPTVWVFPAGAISGCLVVLVLSHIALPGPRSRFHWDRDAARSLYHFGKWIFATSVLEFIARQMDVLLLAYCVDIGKLGVYGRAVNLAEPPATLSMRMSRQVLYPTFSATFRERPWELSRVFYRTRAAIDLLPLMALGLAMTAGSGIVKLLLAPSFWEAGWMFQVLCIRSATKCLFNPLSVCCIAIDSQRSIAISLVIRMVWVVIAVPLGWHWWRLLGVMWAVATSELPILAVLYWTLWRARVVRPSREIMPVLMVGAGCAVGWLLSHFLP